MSTAKQTPIKVSHASKWKRPEIVLDDTHPKKFRAILRGGLVLDRDGNMVLRPGDEIKVRRKAAATKSNPQVYEWSGLDVPSYPDSTKDLSFFDLRPGIDTGRMTFVNRTNVWKAVQIFLPYKVDQTLPANPLRTLLGIGPYGMLAGWGDQPDYRAYRYWVDAVRSHGGNFLRAILPAYQWSSDWRKQRIPYPFLPDGERVDLTKFSYHFQQELRCDTRYANQQSVWTCFDWDDTVAAKSPRSNYSPWNVNNHDPEVSKAIIQYKTYGSCDPRKTDFLNLMERVLKGSCGDPDEFKALREIYHARMLNFYNLINEHPGVSTIFCDRNESDSRTVTLNNLQSLGGHILSRSFTATNGAWWYNMEEGNILDDLPNDTFKREIAQRAGIIRVHHCDMTGDPPRVLRILNNLVPFLKHAQTHQPMVLFDDDGGSGSDTQRDTITGRSRPSFEEMRTMFRLAFARCKELEAELGYNPFQGAVYKTITLKDTEDVLDQVIQPLSDEYVID